MTIKVIVWVPSLAKARLMVIGELAFAAMAPRLWNLLPMVPHLAMLLGMKTEMYKQDFNLTPQVNFWKILKII